VAPLLIAGLLGGGALLFWPRGRHDAAKAEAAAAGALPPGTVITPETLTSNEVHEAVKVALATETSPANLSAFSTVLARAGYPHSSHELTVKASNLL
jgi:hypothetical protein